MNKMEDFKTKSEYKLEATIDSLEFLINHGLKDSIGKTSIHCEVVIEDLYELRRLLHEDLHS